MELPNYPTSFLYFNLAPAPMLSIIIVHYNQENLLKQCLRNISEAKIGLEKEIIIIDNAFTAQSRDFLADWRKMEQNRRVIFNKENVGYAKANNQGIKAAKGEYILILNADVIVLPGSVEALIGLLKQDSLVGLAGPQLLNIDKTIQDSCYRFPRFYTPLARRTFLGKIFFKNELKRYSMRDFDHQQTREVDWLLGACLAGRKRILERVGLFDERYFLYLEDTDLARKIRQNGFKTVYLPSAKMYHFYQRSSDKGGLFKKIVRIHIASALKYFWKWKKV